MSEVVPSPPPGIPGMVGSHMEALDENALDMGQNRSHPNFHDAATLSLFPSTVSYIPTIRA